MEDVRVWRWWDGFYWSRMAYSWSTAVEAAWEAKQAALENDIRWTDYWPENARVPRLDPTGGHWTFNVDGMEPTVTGRVDVYLRNGFIQKRCPVDAFDYQLIGDEWDILAWRPAA